MVILESLRVAPSNVRFTQDSISEVFSDHEHTLEAETIEGTFRKLLYGDISVDNSIRTISVVRKDNQMWVVSGNRRLYVFRKLEEFERISEIPVNVVPLHSERFEKMFTTKNDGRRIYIRQDRTRMRGDKLDDRLRTIYQKWVAQGRPTNGYSPAFTNLTSSNVPSYSGGYSTLPPARQPTISSPRASYVEPSWPRTPSRPPPAPEKKDDGWSCTIL